MTRKTVSILSFLLVAQIGLAFLLVNLNGKNQQVESRALLAELGGDLDRLVVKADDQSLTLVKKADTWALLDGLPVQKSRVDSLLDKLAAIEVMWPVASSEAAHKRLEVHEDKNQKTVQLYAGDALRYALLLGSSPSYRQVHVRRADQDDVFTVSFDSYELSASADAWLDTTLLRPDEEIISVSHADMQLESDNGAPLVEALNQLTVLGVQDQSVAFDDSDVLAFSVKTEDQELRYQMKALDNAYAIQSSAFSIPFRISKTQYDAVEKALAELTSPVAVNDEEDKGQVTDVSDKAASGT